MFILDNANIYLQCIIVNANIKAFNLHVESLAFHSLYVHIYFIPSRRVGGNMHKNNFLKLFFICAYFTNTVYLQLTEEEGRTGMNPAIGCLIFPFLLCHQIQHYEFEVV